MRGLVAVGVTTVAVLAWTACGGDDAGGSGGSSGGAGGEAGFGASSPYEGETVAFPLPPFRESVFDATSNEIVVVGELAYSAAHNDGLVIFDVHDPHSMERLGELEISATAWGLAVESDVAYMAARDDGLVLIDVSDPLSPLELGRLEGINAQRVDVAGGYAYVAGDDLYVVDVSDPSAPSLATTLEGTFDAQDVVVDGGMAYVANGFWGMKVLDVSQPDSPVEVFEDGDPNDGLRIEVDSDHVYLLDGGRIDIYARDALFSGPLDSTFSGADDFVVADGILYVGTANGLERFDISDPSNIAEVEVRLLSARVQAMAVFGDHLLLGTAAAAGKDFPVGVRVVSRHQAPEARYVGNMPFAGEVSNAYSVAMHEGALYIADGSILAVVDVVSPNAPTLGNPLGGFDEAREVRLGGSLGYVREDGGGLHLLDVTSPQSPSVLDIFPGGGVNAFALAGTIPVVATNEGITLLDASDPSQLVALGELEESSADSLAGSDDRLIVSWRDSGERMVSEIDISDPSQPVELASAVAPDCDASGRVAVAGEVILLLCGNSVHTAATQSVLTGPELTFLGSTSTYGAVGHAHARDDLVYVADGLEGMTLIDMSDPMHPAVIGNFIGPDRWTSGYQFEASDLAILDQHVAFADRRGLRVVEAGRHVTLTGAKSEASPGEIVSYEVGWNDVYPDDPEEMTCRTTGGRCTITAVDQDAATLSVDWTVPTAPGEYEIGVAVGNIYYFHAARARMRVR